MNEQERADWLARAVDNLIHHQPASTPPEDPNSQGLDDLLQIAQARLDLTDFIANHGLQHEGSVWQEVLNRLEIPESPSPSASVHPKSPWLQARGGASSLDPGERELQELEQVATLRQRMSAQMMKLAEPHREAVWHEVQARVSARESSRGLFAFLGFGHRPKGRIASPLSEAVASQTLTQPMESHTDELVELIRKRRVIAVMAQQASSEAERRIWPRVIGRCQDDPRATVPRLLKLTWGWQRVAIGAAAVAIAIAALGPIPTTGLADHPFARFVESVGNHVGVAESGPPPVAPGAPTVIRGTPVTAIEASDLLGVAVSDVVDVPADYNLTASLYYEAGLTGNSGTFLRSYISSDGALLLFQEAASDADLAVADGASLDLTLTDGTPATLFTGGWIPGSSRFSWMPEGGQTLVFDRSGLRTVIQFIGHDAAAPELTAIADSLR